MSEQLPKFWLVWVKGRAPPTYQHATADAARAEAARLALTVPASRAYVLEAVNACRAGGVEWLELTEAKEP